MESFTSVGNGSLPPAQQAALRADHTRKAKQPRAVMFLSKPEAMDSTLLGVEDPDWLISFTKNIERLSKLPAGWDGPGSLPISRELLFRATSLVRRYLGDLRRLAAPHAAPGGDGTLQVEWHEKAGEIELDFALDGSVTIWGREHRTGHEFEGDGAEALDLFNRWAPRIAQTHAHAVHVPTQSQSSDFSFAA